MADNALSVGVSVEGCVFSFAMAVVGFFLFLERDVDVGGAGESMTTNDKQR